MSLRVLNHVLLMEYNKIGADLWIVVKHEVVGRVTELQPIRFVCKSYHPISVATTGENEAFISVISSSAPRPLSKSSYPTRVCGIIVKFTLIRWYISGYDFLYPAGNSNIN